MIYKMMVNENELKEAARILTKQNWKVEIGNRSQSLLRLRGSVTVVTVEASYEEE